MRPGWNQLQALEVDDSIEPPSTFQPYDRFNVFKAAAAAGFHSAQPSRLSHSGCSRGSVLAWQLDIGSGWALKTSPWLMWCWWWKAPCESVAATPMSTTLRRIHGRGLWVAVWSCCCYLPHHRNHQGAGRSHQHMAGLCSSLNTAIGSSLIPSEIVCRAWPLLAERPGGPHLP